MILLCGWGGPRHTYERPEAPLWQYLLSIAKRGTRWQIRGLKGLPAYRRDGPVFALSSAAMFASLLPGLRHIRAPLAAGFVWLLGGWLLLADHVPAKQDATGGLETLIALGERLNPVALGAVAAFSAYVVGAIAAEILGPVTRDLSMIYQTFRGNPPSERTGAVPRDPGILFTQSAEVSIKAVASERVGEVRRRLQEAQIKPSAIINATHEFADEEDHQIFYMEHPDSWMQGDFLTEQAQTRSLSEFDLLTTRLMSTDPGLFAEIDRRRAEAELRYQLVPAVLFLDAALAITWTPWVLLALPVAGLLFIQGVRSAEKAGDMVADAVLIGQVTPPAIERVTRIADELIQEGPRA